MTTKEAELQRRIERLTEENLRLTDQIRLLLAIGDAADFSKLEARKHVLEQGVFHLPQMLDETLLTARRTLEERSIAFRVDFDPSLPEQVRGDAGRLRQVIFSLLDNAVRFTHQGSVCFRARLRPQSPGPSALGSTRAAADPADHGPGKALATLPGISRLHVEVQDTGIGLSQEQVRRLFQSFSPSDSGLGLSISRLLVALMGGEIHASSQPRVGSLFWFEIPITVFPPREVGDVGAEKPAIPPADSLEPPAPAEVAGDGPLHVLVVEDNAVNQLVAVSMLNALGHRVTVANNGEEALAAFARDPFDLILMDCHMPGIDGFETCRRIRAGRFPAAAVPIVAMTGSIFVEDRDACQRAGMDGMIFKPVTMLELSRVVEEVARPKIRRPLDQPDHG